MDVLLLNKSSARCVKRLLSALHGFDVDVVESWPELARRLKQGCGACVVICAIRSAGEMRRASDGERRKAGGERSDVAVVIEIAGEFSLYKPIVVIDETFDSIGCSSFMAAGAQDYIPACPLDAVELQQCLDKSVLRHGHRPDNSLTTGYRNGHPDGASVQHARSWAASQSCDWVSESDRAQFKRLTPRQQQVLRLFVNEPNEARVGKQLGIKQQSVYNHLARIQHKLHVSSHAELMKVALILMQTRASAES